MRVTLQMRALAGAVASIMVLWWGATLRAQVPDAAPPAASASIGVDLAWEAPSPCPDRFAVLAQVAELLGHAAETRADRPLRVRARLSTDRGHGWRMNLRATTPDGAAEHDYGGATCAGLAQAAALIIALAIDPEAVAARSPNTSSPPLPVEHVTPSAPWWHAVARLDGVGALGTLPAAAPGFGLALGMQLRALRIEVYGAYLPSRRVAVGPVAGSGGDVELGSGGARACVELASGRFEVGPCLAGEVGSMHGQGYGVTNPAGSSAPWIASYLGVAATWRPVTFFGVRLSVEAGYGIRRPAFAFDEFGTVFTPARVLGRLALGIEWRIP